jgi:hypothetical protein
LGERVEGSHGGLRYARDEPLRLGPARGLSNVRERSTATVTARRGLLRDRGIAYAGRMTETQEEPARTIPQVGDPAPSVALPDENRTVHRLADQRAAGPSSTSIPGRHVGLHHRGVPVPDLHQDIVASDADVWGVSPDGADSHQRFRTKYGLPFTLLRTRTTTCRRGTAHGPSRPTTARRTWGSSVRRS